jgi:hypothetical protein
MGGEKVNTETIEFECVSLSLLAGSFFLDMFFFGTRVPAHSRRLRVHLLLSAWTGRGRRTYRPCKQLSRHYVLVDCNDTSHFI